MPFVVWNIVAFLVGITFFKLTQQNFGDVASMNSLPNIIDGLLGLHRLPANIPIYFLRDLFVIMAFLPLLHFLVRHKGLLAVFLVTIIYVFKDQPGIIFVINELGDRFAIIYRLDTLIFFMFGYGLAFHSVFIISKSKSLNAITGLTLIFLTVFFSYWILELKLNAHNFGPWRTGFGVIFVVSIPVLFALLVAIKSNTLGRILSYLSPYSFTLFLSHYISAHLFSWLVLLASPIVINEQSPLWIQAILLVFYLAFIIGFAIVVRTLWYSSKAKLTLQLN